MRRSKEVIGGKRVKDVGGDGWGCRGGSGAVGAVGAQEGADWYKMFRLCEGHTHFCPRTWKEEEVWGVAG